LDKFTADDMRGWRARCGLTQNSAADVLRIHRNHVAKMEMGIRPIQIRIALAMWYFEQHGPPPDGWRI